VENNPKLDRIQNWVNSLAENAEDGSSSSGRQSAQPAPVELPKKKKNNFEPKKVEIKPEPKGPPKVRQKYTTTGRRTSSMSGLDISKTTKKNSDSKISDPVDFCRIAVKPDFEEAKVPDDWTLLKLQNGMDNSESSSYEMINSMSDFGDEFEQVSVCITMFFFIL
jgi:hypothetical protein